MNKKYGGLRKFFGEFKKFVTRGNVLDMAVGVIVGGAFTAIVTALSDHILKPLINWVLALILGKDALSEIFTFLKRGYDANGALSLENSIYIDWGAFINSVINFLLIAFVLFCIVKAMNKFAEAGDRIMNGLEAERKAVAKYRKEGLTREEASKKYAEDLKKAEEAKAEETRLAEEKAAAEKAALEAKETANTRLLEEIRDLLKQQGNS